MVNLLLGVYLPGLMPISYPKPETAPVLIADLMVNLLLAKRQHQTYFIIIISMIIFQELFKEFIAPSWKAI